MLLSVTIKLALQVDVFSTITIKLTLQIFVFSRCYNTRCYNQVNVTNDCISYCLLSAVLIRRIDACPTNL